MKTSSQLRVLRNPSFGLLWTAGLISITGTWLLSVALPIFIYKLTDSPAATATAVGVRVAIGLIAAPLAGVYVDRWDRKKVLIYANVLHAVTLLPLLAVDSADDLWIAYLVIAAQALFAVFVMPAEHALLPRLVDEPDLPAANGMNALNNNIARLLGPALGALVAATLGLTGAVLLDSASFLIAAGLCVLIGGAHRAEPGSGERHHAARDRRRCPRHPAIRGAAGALRGHRGHRDRRRHHGLAVRRLRRRRSARRCAPGRLAHVGTGRRRNRRRARLRLRRPQGQPEAPAHGRARSSSASSIWSSSTIRAGSTPSRPWSCCSSWSGSRPPS